MLNDLLASNNYVSFNIKLAHTFGLLDAIYIAEIFNIENKAVQKKKLVDIDNNVYMVLDRKYLTERTTLSLSQQQEIETRLVNFGILIKHPSIKDAIYIDIDKVAGVSELKSKSLNVVAAAAKPQKLTKAQKVLDSVVAHINTTNPELKAAYIDWLTAVQTKHGYVSTSLITTAETTIDNFSGRNLDVALEVVRIAASMGWKDISYAIAKYKETHTSLAVNKVTTTPVELGAKAF